MTKASAEYEALAAVLPDVLSHPDDSLADVRATFAAVHGHDPGPGVEVTPADHGLWVRSATTASTVTGAPVVFFVHGGGFVTSPASTYAFYAANIVRACDVGVFVAEYRLAPETVFPGPIDDVVAAYKSVLEDGIDPSSISFVGDSCGGGMALASLVRLRDEGVALPAAMVGLSGWFDLTASGESALQPVGRDPLLDVAWLRKRGLDYVGPNGDPSASGPSPLNADLQGLPPMLLQAGEVDRCRSDAERVAAKVQALGGSAIATIYPGMPHGFQGLVGIVPEADAALAEVRDFVAGTIERSSTA